MRKALVLRRGTAWKIAACGLSPVFIAASAEAQTFAISLGVRETGSTAPIGHPSSPTNTGQVEWINLDGQVLNLGGGWQQFVFNFGTDPVSNFAGNGVLDGTRGTLEHIRIRNSSGIADPITFHIDDVVNTVGGTPIVLSGFEQTDPDFPAFPGIEHMFQEPGFSGSTASNVVGAGSSLVVDDVFHTGAQSTRVNMQFVDGTNTRWVRLTTAGPLPQQNPTIDFSAGNSLSFWMRAVVAPPAQRWLGPGGGNWSDSGQWGTNSVPNSTSAVANFLDDITQAATINVDIPITVNTIRLKTELPVTFNATNDGMLTFDGGANVPRGINNEIGSHTINAPITLNMRAVGTGTFAEAFFTVARPQDVLTVNSDITYNNTSGALNATLTVQKFGPGQLNITNLETDNPITAPLRILVQQGTMRFIPNSGRTRVNGVTIAGGATPTAQLDITNNPLVLDYAETSPLQTVRAQVASGFAGGSWNGPGIISSNANAGQLAVGYGEANALPSVPAIFGTVDGDAVLLRLTRYGDANLDGIVNLADFNRLAANFGSTDAVWTQGDFNYDGLVNLADFNRLAANFGLQAGPDGPTPDDWSNLASAVPEPTSLALLGVGAVGLVRRRRRD